MKIFTSLLVAFFLAFVCSIQILPPHSFSEELIAHDIQGEWVSSDFPDLEAIASRPFHYLGHGLQSVAFESEDGKYVIKFFLSKVIRFRKKIVFPFLHKEKWSRKRDVFDVLGIYDLAFRELKEETGLIGVHLSANQANLPSCIIRDWNEKEHRIDLNRVSFVLQYRCVMLNEACKKMKPADIFSALTVLLDKRSRKGFTDIRRRFNIENYGFLGTRAVMIDAGGLEYVEGIKKDPEVETQRVMKWACQRIEKRHPGFISKMNP